MEAVYLHDWADDGEAQMLWDFGIEASALEGAEVIVASYTFEDYEGSAYVLFRRDGKLWEVFGSHCSCYGLSESDYRGDTKSQWEPEECDEAALRHRIENGQGGFDEGVTEAIKAAMNWGKA